MIPKKVKKQFVNVNVFDKKGEIKKAILDKARKKKQIIYGARALQEHNPIFSRETSDYDIFARHPKKSADNLQRELDILIGYDHFFLKSGEHKGTWKVKSRGKDLRKNTKDDIGIVDYTKMPSPSPKFIIKDKLRMRTLKEEIRAKKKSIADPKFAFRHQKDKDDLRRIKAGMELKKAIAQL